MRVLAVRPHAREREHGARTSSAPMVAAAPRGGEDDVPARQVDGEEVVEAVRGEPTRRAARERRLVDAVHVRHLHRHARVGTRLGRAAGIRAVMPRPHGRVREQDLRGVGRELGIEETARRQVGRRHLARTHRRRIVQHEQPAARTRAVAEALRELVAHSAWHELSEEEPLPFQALQRMRAQRLMERAPLRLVGGLLRRRAEPGLAETRPQRHHGLRERARLARRADAVLQPPVPLHERGRNRGRERRRALHGTSVKRCAHGDKRPRKNALPFGQGLAIEFPARAAGHAPPARLPFEAQQKKLRVAARPEPDARDRAERRLHGLSLERHAAGIRRERAVRGCGCACGDANRQNRRDNLHGGSPCRGQSV